MLASNKGKMYSNVTEKLELENYLCILLSNISQYLCWFRTANHKLAVETGR